MVTSYKGNYTRINYMDGLILKFELLKNALDH